MEVTLETPAYTATHTVHISGNFPEKNKSWKRIRKKPMSVIKYQSSKDVTFEHYFHEMKDRDHVQFRDTF